MDRPRVEAFNERFPPDDGAAGPFLGWTREDTQQLFGAEPALFTEFMTSQARASYERGLFRALGPATAPSIVEWNRADGWRARWPQYAKRLVVFGYDWMGRLYALDRERALQGEPLVARLDPGEGTISESDTTFAEFVLSDAVHHPDQLLDRDGFHGWLGAGGRPLRQGEVAGYVEPPFRGGPEAISNREIVDVRSYVATMGRAYAIHTGTWREPRRSLRARVAAMLRRGPSDAPVSREGEPAPRASNVARGDVSHLGLRLGRQGATHDPTTSPPPPRPTADARRGNASGGGIDERRERR